MKDTEVIEDIKTKAGKDMRKKTVLFCDPK